MEERQTTWKDAEKFVSELIQDAQRQSKRWFIAFVVTLVALIGTNAYWIYVFNSYEYVSQDGEGINTINTGNQEDINYGAESEDKEEW